MATARRPVDLKDLAAVDLKPAVLYHAARRIAAGEHLDHVALDLNLTPEQTLYLDKTTTPETVG